jgi:hypothetical protein
MPFSASILFFSQSMMLFGIEHHLSAYEGKVCIYFKEANSSQAVDVCAVGFFWDHDIYSSLPPPWRISGVEEDAC